MVKDASGTVKESEGYQDTPGLASGLFSIKIGSEFYQAAGQVQAAYLQFTKSDGTIVSTVGITFTVLDDPMSVTTEQSQVYIGSVNKMIDDASFNIKNAIDTANNNANTLNDNIKQFGANFKSQVDTANSNVETLTTSLTSVKNSVSALNTQVQTIQTGVNTHSIASQDDLQSVDESAVHLDKNEVITGQKNFTGGLLINGDDIQTMIKSQSIQTDSKGQPIFNDKIIYTGNVTSAPSITLTDAKGSFQITPPTNLNNGPIFNYNVYYTLEGSGSIGVLSLASNQLTGSVPLFNDQKGDIWDIYVTAINSFGESPKSGVVKQTYEAIDGNIYTLKYDGSATGGLTRADAAVGLVAGVDGAKNDFDGVGPWTKITKVTDSFGNVFVRIPKTYIRKQPNGNGQNWSVSLVSPIAIPSGQPLNDATSGWYLPKCFWDFTNNKELGYVDVGAYEAGLSSDNKMTSLSGVTAAVSQTISTFRTYARNNNTGSLKGYQQLDIHVVDLLQVLFIVEFATLNSQLIMSGATNNSAQVANGLADNIKGTSGTGTSSVMSYRGIENLYGNLFQFVDGINASSNTVYVCDNANNYASDTFAYPYQSAYTLATSSGYISKMGYSSTYPEVSLPTDTSGSDSTYYSDYAFNGSSNKIFIYGGYWGYASYAGFFYGAWNNSSLVANALTSSRLIKKALS